MNLTLSEFLKKIKSGSASNSGEFTSSLFFHAGNKAYEMDENGSVSLAEKIYNGKRKLSDTENKGRMGFPKPIHRDEVKSFLRQNIGDDSMLGVMKNFNIANGEKSDIAFFLDALCTQLQNCIGNVTESVEDVVANEFYKITRNKNPVENLPQSESKKVFADIQGDEDKAVALDDLASVPSAPIVKLLSEIEQKKLVSDLGNLSYILPKINALHKLLHDYDFAPTPFPTAIFYLMDEVNKYLNMHFFNQKMADGVTELLNRQRDFEKFLEKFSSVLKDKNNMETDYSQIKDVRSDNFFANQYFDNKFADFDQVEGIHLDIEADYSTPFDANAPYNTKLHLQHLREAYYWSIDAIIKLEKELTDTMKG